MTTAGTWYPPTTYEPAAGSGGWLITLLQNPPFRHAEPLDTTGEGSPGGGWLGTSHSH